MLKHKLCITTFEKCPNMTIFHLCEKCTPMLSSMDYLSARACCFGILPSMKWF